MKLFIVSDVHSFYDELMESLTKAGWDINNDEHVFVSLGDLLDRGDKPRECLDFVNSIPDDRKILIRGNHEDLAEEIIGDGYFRSHDYSNGTASTIAKLVDYNDKPSYSGYHEMIEDFSHDHDWIKYINSCVDFWENSDNVFCHGWLPCEGLYYGTGKLLDPELIPKDAWTKNKCQDARWLNGMDMWNKGARVPGKTIWCGHWHTSWGHSLLHNKGVEWDDEWELTGKKTYQMYTEPFIDDGIVAMDACTALCHEVNCKTIEVPKEDIEKGKIKITN